MALQDVGRFFATFGASGDLDYLGNLWDAIGQQVPSDQQIPCDGIGTFHSDSDGIPDHIVICFPVGPVSPETRNEAYFLAAVKQDDVARDLLPREIGESNNETRNHRSLRIRKTWSRRIADRVLKSDVYRRRPVNTAVLLLR